MTTMRKSFKKHVLFVFYRWVKEVLGDTPILNVMKKAEVVPDHDGIWLVMDNHCHLCNLTIQLPRDNSTIFK